LLRRADARSADIIYRPHVTHIATLRSGTVNDITK